MIRSKSISLAILGVLLTQSLTVHAADPLSPGSSSSEVKAPTSPSAEVVSESTDSSSSDEKTEKIEVTGSHIKRIDTEGVSPVTTIDRKALEKTGYNSVGDVLRDTTTNSFGSQRESSGSNAAGNAEVNLRGLGSSNTLVLLNGQRLPSDAVTGAVDLNLIPIAAVERVEILADGASAIYGSDALGGVVNVITRKDFSGNEVSIKQSVPQSKGGAKSEISLVNGINGEKLNMVNVLQFRDNKVVNSRDREWTDHSYSNLGDPGSYRDVGTAWRTDPNCPADRVVVTPQGNFCRFKFSDYSTELPALQQLSVLSETNYEASSSVKLTARVGGTRRKVNWSFAPAPGQFTIPAAVADGLGLPGHTNGQDLNVRYRLTDLGTRDADVTAYAYNALLGSSIQLGGGWALDVTTAHNMVYNTDRGVNGYALTAQLQALIASGAYNPFGTPGAKGSLESARYVPEEKTKSQLSSVEVKTSGEIGAIADRPIGLAVGSTVTYQKYSDEFDARSVAGDVFGNAGSSGGGQRNTKAAYLEFSVPATEKLEVQLAGRYDKYSDFGSTFNPKAAVLFHASKDVLFRGSVGTGFKAPLMQEMYAATSDGNPTFIDAVACKAERTAGGATPSCLPQQYNVTSSGNPGLKEQTSLSFNAGTVVQATNDLSFGGDWFLTKTKNVVGIDYGDLTAAEAAGIDPTRYGVTPHRDAQGYLEYIDAPLQNLSSQDVSGIDLSVGYRLGRFRFSTDQSHILFFKEQGFPGMPSRNKVGENGMPSWRNTTSVTFLPRDNQSVSLTGLTIGGHKKAVEEEGNLSHYTSLDLQYVYTTKSIGEFTFGLRNVLGTTPPIDDSNSTRPLDTTLYDQIGRQVLAGYKLKF